MLGTKLGLSIAGAIVLFTALCQSPRAWRLEHDGSPAGIGWTHHASCNTQFRGALEDEVAWCQGECSVQLDLEIGNGVAVDISGHDRVGVDGLLAKLTGHSVEGNITDESKGLVTPRRSVGVDRGEVDRVGTLLKPHDLIASGGGRAALIERIEIETVSALPAGLYVSAEAADQDVIAEVARQRIVAALPLSTLLPVVPCSTLFRLLPVPLMLPSAVSVRFSMLWSHGRR